MLSLSPSLRQNLAHARLNPSGMFATPVLGLRLAATTPTPDSIKPDVAGAGLPRLGGLYGSEVFHGASVLLGRKSGGHEEVSCGR